MKVYIAGKITGDPNYKQKFKVKEMKLTHIGHNVMNPALLPDGFGYEDYMKICFSMIDVCDAVHFMPCWEDSEGAKREFQYATSRGKQIFMDKDE